MKPYLKKTTTKEDWWSKWFKWWRASLASIRPWVQTPVSHTQNYFKVQEAGDDRSTDRGHLVVLENWFKEICMRQSIHRSTV
jgi:hypothetical protein